MSVPDLKSRKRNGSARGTILLLDDAPQNRAERAEKLTRRGFEVKIASSVQQAESIWRPDSYTLVLVSVGKDLQRAADFCHRLKEEFPHQTIGMSVPPATEFPPTTCPDLIWPEENLDYFVARVETLAHFSPAA